MNGVGGYPGIAGQSGYTGTETVAESTEPRPGVLPDELPVIPDSTLLQIMQRDYERSRSARETRKKLNRRNWDALHGKFDFLAKKRPGQSQIVIPSLETSLEQVCAQLTEQLVGFKQWFTGEYEGDLPPLPEFDADEACRILRVELERLAVDGGCMPTTYGMHRLIYDSLKLGLIESEVCWKVAMVPEPATRYLMQKDPKGFGPGQMVLQESESMRLRIDLVPFDDFFPDPSAAKQYMIHEMEVPISALPDLGFSKEQIDRMRHASPGMQKLEEQRRRSGMAGSLPAATNRVMLREYWGDLIQPQTGELLARGVTFMTAGDTFVCKQPERIRDIHWHGLRPFIHVPLLPTPTAEQHHAFLDIAVPLIEAECELFNLMCDAGFHAALGVKEIRSYMLTDQTVMAKGLVAGLELEVADGYPNQDVVKRVETGTLTQDMLTVFDRIARTRQEATRTNDLQLGRQAMRKTSATEINQITESSDDLFSNMALRFEDTAIEPLLELCWLTLWQDADQSMIERIGATMRPEHAQTIAVMTPEERFVAFSKAVSFKVQGYKYQLQSVKDTQTIMSLFQFGMQNPAFMQVLQTQIDPVKFYQAILRSKGIDPADFAPDAQTMPMDPTMMQGQAGNPGGNGAMNPAQSPDMGSVQGQMTPPNQMGVRGIQQP